MSQIRFTSGSNNQRDGVPQRTALSDTGTGFAVRNYELPGEGWPKVGGLAAGDVNGDGRTDVAVTVNHNTPTQHVPRQTADGRLAAAKAWNVYQMPGPWRWQTSTVTAVRTWPSTQFLESHRPAPAALRRDAGRHGAPVRKALCDLDPPGGGRRRRCQQ